MFSKNRFRHNLVSICFALGNKSGSFCEAVNCEQSEQEGKFLFAMLVTISWITYHGLFLRCWFSFYDHTPLKMHFG